MRRNVSIFLLLVFFHSIVGFHLSFLVEQWRIKEEIKEKMIRNLPDSELAILKIHAIDSRKIKWVEDFREFKYEGNMFDVVKIKKEADITYYYCYHDSRESRLMANLDKLVRDQSNHSQSRTIQKKQVVNYLAYEVFHEISLPESTIQYYNLTSGYKFHFCDILIPPPRFFSKV